MAIAGICLLARKEIYFFKTDEKSQLSEPILSKKHI